jgi:cyanocobalamin reductase (cyanide-eliminating) / alkylcobalamin dealkylase
VTRGAWQEAVERVTAGSQTAGLDLVHPFAVGWFNERVSEAERLDDFNSPGSLGILIGNSRELWPPFTRRLETHPELGRTAHPLDRHVEQTAASLLAELEPIRARAYFAHVTRPRAVPMQRLAEAVGFAGLGPVQLSIHPRIGPWFALRAVLVVDILGPQGGPPALERPCQGCSQPCVAPFQRALASAAELTARSVAEHAEKWIAVRDACPIGRDFRYGEDQLAYHYHLMRAPVLGPGPQNKTS